MRIGVVVLGLLAACGDGGGSDTPDAMPTPDAFARCATMPPTPLATGKLKLFLSTEGVTLTKGPDNARANTTSLITPYSVVVPRLFDGNADRDMFITQIVGFVQSRLAPYSIDVVTTRPESGDYFMTVIGGTATALINNPNVLSVAPARCLPTINAMSLVFDNGVDPAPRRFYANSILSDFGAMAGLALATLTNDCMCRTGDGCMIDEGTLCTFGTAVPVDPAFSCNRGTTADEPLLLQQALGCR